MESEDEMERDVPVEERNEMDWGEEVGEEEDGEEGEEEEGEGEGEEEDEMEEECSVKFNGDINPLDFVKDGTSQVQLYQHFERLEFEALAEKKRKALASNLSGSDKRLRQEMRQMTAGEAETITDYLGGGRRRSKKPKKRGRRKGSRNKLSPEITKKLGDANLHYAHGRYEDVIGLVNEVVLLAPNLPDPYHTLGLVYNSMGDKSKSVDCYLIAAFVGPKDSSLWKLLVTWSIELGKIEQAWWCIKKAIKADPADATLWYHRASLSMAKGNYSVAAESYDRIVQICPDNVEALKTAATVSS